MLRPVINIQKFFAENFLFYYFRLNEFPISVRPKCTYFSQKCRFIHSPGARDGRALCQPEHGTRTVREKSHPLRERIRAPPFQARHFHHYHRLPTTNAGLRRSNFYFFFSPTPNKLHNPLPSLVAPNPETLTMLI